MVDVDTEGLADVDGPDLRSQVRLEVELTADVGPCCLAVLADHDERREEDCLQADNHRQQAERELVEGQRAKLRRVQSVAAATRTAPRAPLRCFKARPRSTDMRWSATSSRRTDRS